MTAAASWDLEERAVGYGCQGPWWSALMDDVSSGDGKRSMFESSWPAFHHARPLAVTSSHVTATDPTTAISLSKQERASALAVFLGFRRKYEKPCRKA